jgi:hypothetical protein
MQGIFHPVFPPFSDDLLPVDEEDAGAKAVNGLAEFQLLQHLQFGETDTGTARYAS